MKFPHLIRPAKINEISILVEALKKVYDSRVYILQEKFIQWAYNSPYNKDIIGNDELSVMCAFNQNSKIDAAIGFVPNKFFVDSKEVQSLWDINYNNFSKFPGLALECLKNLRKLVKVYSGNNLNKKCIRSYQRVFNKKNFKEEINRKIAIIDYDQCNKITNPKNEEKVKNFLASNETQIKETDFVEINSFSKISKKYWEDHLKRFTFTYDRRIPYLEWRFLNHPYLKYHIISTDEKASAGLAVVRVEKIKNLQLNFLRILDLLPTNGNEDDLQKIVLEFAKKNKCIVADFFCSSSSVINKICFKPFLDFNDHKEYKIPHRLQPIEITEKNSFNLFLDLDSDLSVDSDELYSTKTDGEGDLFLDQNVGFI